MPQAGERTDWPLEGETLPSMKRDLGAKTIFLCLEVEWQKVKAFILDHLYVLKGIGEQMGNGVELEQPV